MDERSQLENFVGFTEIRNAYLKLPPKEVPVGDNYFEIDDQIVYDYERALQCITTLKTTAYDRMKHENQLKVKQTIKETSTNNPYYTKVENDVCIQTIQAQLEVDDVVYNNTHTTDTEQYIETSKKAYIEYMEKAQNVLKAFDFFHIDHAHILTREQLMTSKNYQIYLKKIFEEIMDLSKYVSNYRMQDDKYQNTLHNKLVVNKQDTLSSNNYFHHYFNQYYEFTDNNVIIEKQRLLNELLMQLFILLKCVKNTHAFLNAIINTHYISNKSNSFLDKLMENRTEYTRQRLLNAPLLPTSWTEWFKYKFMSKKVNGQMKYPLEDYFRYISFWFEQNKILNEELLFTITNHNTNQIPDFVSFIFDLRPILCSSEDTEKEKAKDV